MKLYLLPLFTAIFFNFGELKAQKETNNWFFGQFAGLTFNTNPPSILTNGAVNTTEGCSSASDANGNLLFYTNGVTVYNKNHVMMANGSGLFGGTSSSQALIVKKPGNGNIYYIFTQDYQNQWNYGLRYTTVDISLAAGMGSVTSKNDSLHGPSTEKLTAVNHCNGRDIWVMSHDWLSSNFRAFLVTSAGVNTVAVVSTIGTFHTGGLLNSAAMGGMKFSPNGRKLGVAYPGATYSNIELYDFDNLTGVVSNSLLLTSNFYGPYSCEFSPDGTKLYATGHVGTMLSQWDLCAGSNSAIIASQYTVSGSQHGALQIASNGKIYVSRHTSSTLGVINNPNLAGAACNYVNLGQSTAPKSQYLGLPNFVTSYFDNSIYLVPLVTPNYTTAVTCNSVSFTPPNIPSMSSNCSTTGYTLNSVSWIFNDPASGAADTSFLQNPVHIYSAAGTYTPMMLLHYRCKTDTIRKVITVSAPPTLSLTGKTQICKGESYILNAAGASSYSWSTGATSSSISVNPSVTTTYTLYGNGSNSCSALKVFTVTVSSCTDINEQTTKTEMQLYPNPNSGTQFFIEIEKEGSITVFNELGEVILYKDVNAGKNMIEASLSSGIYLVMYKSSQGNVFKKLVCANVL